MRSVFSDNKARRKLVRAGLLGVSATACVAALSISTPSAAQMTEFSRTQTTESSVGRDPYQFTFGGSTGANNACDEIPVPEGKTLTITGINGLVTGPVDTKPAVFFNLDGGGGTGWGFTTVWSYLPIEISYESAPNFATYSLTANPMMILGKPSNAPEPFTASICVRLQDSSPTNSANMMGWISGYLEDDHDFFSGTMLLLP